MDEPITVVALDRTLTFEDMAELAEHVEDILACRGGIYDPLECAAITKLAELANGQVSADVHRISRALRFHSPSDNAPPKPPTPYDAALAEADEKLLAGEERWLQARQAERQVAEKGRRAVAEARQAGGSRDEINNRVVAVNLTFGGRLTAAVEAVRVAREDLQRLRVRRNALSRSQSQWRNDREARFYDKDNPSVPLTFEQMQKRRGQ